MFKGKILKFSGTYAIVCSDTLSYEKIKLKPQMEIGQTIYYFEEDIIQAPQTESTSIFSKLGNISFAYKVAPLMVVLLLAVMVFNHQQISPTSIPAYGVVSIDINPSLSLLLGEDGHVKYAEGKNQDGNSLLESLSLVDKPLKLALEEIIAASESAGYLESKEQIFIATTEQAQDHMVRRLIEQALETSRLDDPYTVYVAEVDYSLYESAEEENISIGHYYLENTSDESSDKLFDAETIEKIILEDAGAIVQHQPKKSKENQPETITEKQDEKRLEQEEHKEEVLEKQENKGLEQEQHKQDIQEKQDEKRQDQEERKEDMTDKQDEKLNTPKNTPASSNKTPSKNTPSTSDDSPKDENKVTSGNQKDKEKDKTENTPEAEKELIEESDMDEGVSPQSDSQDTPSSKEKNKDKEKVDNETSKSNSNSSKQENTSKDSSNDSKAEKDNSSKKK
jgi:hypothetical protein